MEKEMATYSRILAWEIPRTEEPGGYSPWGHKSQAQVHTYACKAVQSTTLASHLNLYEKKVQ